MRITAGLLSVGALCAANVAGSSQEEKIAPPPNMKGRVYPGIANALDNFPLQHRGKYFDMLAPPITTHYSEVFWTAQPAMDLPAHIVQEFAGRAISFTGFEVDIVQVFPNGTEVPDVPSIPSYEVYNHHYCATVRGEKAKMVYVGKGTAKKNGVKRRAIEVNPAEWEPRAVEGDSANWTVPTAQNFWQGNGGEHRMSFKHFPEGSGQLVESPVQFILQPMLINTKNPKGPGPGREKRVEDAAPLPKNSVPQPGDGAKYSGLMECPCTTRVKKILSGYQTKTSGSGCAASLKVATPKECFTAGASLLGDVTANVTDPAGVHAPAGCYVTSHSKGASRTAGAKFEVHFNSA